MTRVIEPISPTSYLEPDSSHEVLQLEANLYQQWIGYRPLMFNIKTNIEGKPPLRMLRVVKWDEAVPNKTNTMPIPQIILPDSMYKDTKSQGHKLIAAHNILPGFGGSCSAVMMLPSRWTELDGQIWSSRFNYNEPPHKLKPLCATALLRGIRMQCGFQAGKYGLTALEQCNDLLNRATDCKYFKIALSRQLFPVVPPTNKGELETKQKAYIIFSSKPSRAAWRTSIPWPL